MWRSIQASLLVNTALLQTVEVYMPQLIMFELSTSDNLHETSVCKVKTPRKTDYYWHIVKGTENYGHGKILSRFRG